MTPPTFPFAAIAKIFLLCGWLFFHAMHAEGAAPQPCIAGEGDIAFGFYAFFMPVSYSAATDSDAAGFHTHRGYEADLLSALEEMDGAGLSFSRHPIAVWDDIWLQSAREKYDMVGGGITITDARTRDAAGKKVIAFTAGHIAFRQSLLVRAEDALRFATYAGLTDDMRIGALAGSTGEARLLQLTGLADAGGVLTAGTRIDTPRGMFIANGGADYFISAAAESPNLTYRRQLHPPSANMPRVIYLGDELGEVELLNALGERRIDAIIRGEIGNRYAARASGGAFVIAAIDSAIEFGGFTLAAENTAIINCIDDKINYLTDHRRIGYAQWFADPQIFLRRARAWRK